MKLYNVKLLTITCEILAQENILEILKKHKITGYTKYEVDGNGARGLRGQGFKNEKNIKIPLTFGSFSCRRKSRRNSGRTRPSSVLETHPQ